MGDFNLLPDSPEYARLLAPFTDGTPALRDAWHLVQPGRRHAPTVGLHDDAPNAGMPFTFDFAFVSSDLAGAGAAAARRCRRDRVRPPGPAPRARLADAQPKTGWLRAPRASGARRRRGEPVGKALEWRFCRAWPLPGKEPILTWDYPQPFTCCPCALRRGHRWTEPHEQCRLCALVRADRLGAFRIARARHRGLPPARPRDGDPARRIRLHPADPARRSLLLATWLVGGDGKLSMERRFQLVRASDGATVLRGRWELVCIDISGGRPRRMPPEFLAAYMPQVVPGKLTRQLHGPA
jgi:acyl-CoA thioester hydrolase